MMHPSKFHSIFFLLASSLAAIIVDISGAFNVLPIIINKKSYQYHYNQIITSSSSSFSSSSSSSSSSSALRYKNEGSEPVDSNSDNNSDKQEQEKQDMVAMNVLGTALRPCCNENGEYCNLFRLFDNPEVFDDENHQIEFEEETVCCQVTPQFLNYAESNLGKDLQKTRTDGSPGLKAGDIGCITVDEWADAYNAGMAPYLFLESTHSSTLDYVLLDFLQVFAIDLNIAQQRLKDLNKQKQNLEDLL